MVFRGRMESEKEMKSRRIFLWLPRRPPPRTTRVNRAFSFNCKDKPTKPTRTTKPLRNMKTSTIGAFVLAASAVLSRTAAVPAVPAAHRGGPTEPAAVFTEEPAAMSAEDNAPTNPDGNTDAAVISSCDDLPADVVDADGLVLVRGPIICHQTKVRMDGRIFSLAQQTTYTRRLVHVGDVGLRWPCCRATVLTALETPLSRLEYAAATAVLRRSSSVYVSLFASVARMKKQKNFPRASEQKNSRALFRICTPRKGLEFQTKCAAQRSQVGQTTMRAVP